MSSKPATGVEKRSNTVSDIGRGPCAKSTAASLLFDAIHEISLFAREQSLALKSGIARQHNTNKNTLPIPAVTGDNTVLPPGTLHSDFSSINEDNTHRKVAVRVQRGTVHSMPSHAPGMSWIFNWYYLPDSPF